MFTFPDAISRLVFQYPTKREVTFSTQVIRFLGGSEQRYPIASALRQWQAQPVLLPDKELRELESFFALVGGSNTSFEFTDLWDGSVYPICYFKDDAFESTSTEQDRTTVVFTILEGRVQS